MASFLILAAGTAQAATAPDPGEFIKVGGDQWSFAGAESGRRFVPWGSNLVLEDKADLDNFGPRYSNERYRRVLDACKDLNFNLLKVFLPIAQVLPDPQAGAKAQIAPGYLDNLDGFLALSRDHGIRVTVCLAPWGGNGCAWWHEGGQYFGREPWKTDEGVDSIGVLCDFWKQFGQRFGDNPTIFSMSPCAEWTLPMLNLTWFPPKGETPRVESEQGRWYWRAWIEAKYEHIGALNSAWETDHETFAAVGLPSYAYDHGTHKYADPEAMILDYQNFRDWTTLRYFTPQIEAIRATMPRHMVTISNHMRFWDLWEGAAQSFVGTTPFEQKHLVDYTTVHTHFHVTDPFPDRTDEDIIRNVQGIARFVGAGKPMPIILEEFSFTSRDPERTAAVQKAMVEGSIGHISGWTTWYLQFPKNPAEGADPVGEGVKSYWLDENFEPSPWGITARGLYGQLIEKDLARIPAVRTIALDRRTELVPKELGVVLRCMKETDPAKRPVDFTLDHEPDLHLRLKGDPAKR